MDDENKDDIYNLLTKLCEKFIEEKHGYVSQKLLKKLRSRGYEILLGKSPHRSDYIQNENKILPGYDDPVCQIMAWNLQLVVDYGLKTHADKLNEVLEKINEKYGEDDRTIKSILSFLFQLRTIPTNNNAALRKSNSVIRGVNSHFRINPRPVLSTEYQSTYSLLSPIMESRPLKNSISYNFMNRMSISKFTSVSQCKSLVDAKRSENDEGYHSPNSAMAFTNRKNEDITCKTIYDCAQTYSSSSLMENIGSKESIWDLAVKQKDNKRRTWETLGNINPSKDKPFLSETDSSISAYAFHLNLSVYNDNCLEKMVVSREEFIKCCNMLLLANESKCFVEEESGYVLVPKIMIEGISSLMLKTMCRDFIFCANCYKGLSSMASSSRIDSGYIYLEFCESINRYLRFYEEMVRKKFKNMPLLELHENIHKIRSQLSVLANICKVGPFYTPEELPHGVSLINYLYEHILTQVDKSVLMVLLSVLYPCCQVYFNMFLQPWVFDGVRYDTEEFFIHVAPKYLASQGRTFWTRSYNIKEDLIPHFLTNSHLDIWNCGKSINLLKICVPKSPFCQYITKNKLYFSCCSNRQQLKLIEQHAYKYYLEGLQTCGPILNIANCITRSKEQEDIFLTLVAKKRATTLKRIELEKLQKLEEANTKRREELAILKEQYEAAIENKALQVIDDIKREIQIKEANMQLQILHEKLVESEANNLIDYYNKLNEISEERKQNAERNIERLKKMQLDMDFCLKPPKESNSQSSLNNQEDLEIDKIETVEVNDEDSELDDSEISINLKDTTLPESNEAKGEMQNSLSGKSIPSSHSLDRLNANNIDVNNVRNIAEENFRIARKNKEKVMNLEMHITLNDTPTSHTKKLQENDNLTAAQRNKLRVLSSEFGIDVTKTPVTNVQTTFSPMEVNRNKNTASNECFGSYYKTEALDNANFLIRNEVCASDLNKNLEEENVLESELENNFEEDDLKNIHMDKLTLNLNKCKAVKSPSVEAMSIGSTPMSDIGSSSSPSENKLKLNIGVAQYESLPSCSLIPTAATNFSEESFHFGLPLMQKNNETFLNRKPSKPKLSKKISLEDAEPFTSSSLKIFLQESITIPLNSHLKLVENELLKFYINDLQYLTHLNSLRSYFFLLDGEFARNITEGLFETLYDVNQPTDLISLVVLRNLVQKALNSSSRLQDNSHCVSLKINDIPKSFNLRDPNVLDCLSLAYHVSWPLNIVLPTDTIAKYDEVFKFLIKLHRVSWVLKKIFVELKFLEKQVSTKQTYLMTSPQYQRLHQCRHVMTHFIQTFQSYIVGDVLQSSWKIFEKDLSEVSNIDQLYQLHTTYIKNILFMCLLNQRSSPIRQTIHKIYTLIFKFYDYLRSREWECSAGVYTHPNFKKLDDIFMNFEQMIQYLFKTCRKVAKSGYQPQLNQFLDMLDLSNYYSSNISPSTTVSTATSV